MLSGSIPFIGLSFLGDGWESLFNFVCTCHSRNYFVLYNCIKYLVAKKFQELFWDCLIRDFFSI